MTAVAVQPVSAPQRPSATLRLFEVALRFFALALTARPVVDTTGLSLAVQKFTETIRSAPLSQDREVFLSTMSGALVRSMVQQVKVALADLDNFDTTRLPHLAPSLAELRRALDERGRELAALLEEMEAKAQEHPVLMAIFRAEYSDDPDDDDVDSEALLAKDATEKLLTLEELKASLGLA